jgi:hypothetical protein
VPTLNFACGAECGLTGAQGGSLTAPRHWTSLTGTAPTIETVLARTGQAFRFTTTAASGRWARNMPAATRTAVMRVAIRFETLPNIDTTLAGWGIGAGGAPMLRYRTATTDLVPAVGVTNGATGFTVTTGVWYICDIKCDTSANPRTCTAEIRVDGAAAATDLGAASSAVAAADLVTLRIGNGASAETPTADIIYDDLAHSVTLADYPLGPGKVHGLVPTGDGLHNFGVPGNFQGNATTDLDPTDTDTFGYVDHLLNSISDFVSATAADDTEYMEWTFDSIPPVSVVNGIEVVSGHHSQGTAANKSSLRIMDSGIDTDVMTDVDVSFPDLNVTSLMVPVAPSTGLAWTKAQVDACTVQWGSSWTTADVADIPDLDGIVLEVDYVPAVPTLTLTTALACFTIDHLVTFSVGSPPQPPVEGAPGNAFVRQFGIGSRLNHVHRFLLGETEDR